MEGGADVASTVAESRGFHSVGCPALIGGTSRWRAEKKKCELMDK